MKLVCPECRRENEVERIYCHDCGARLDRSALAKEKPTEEDPKETQRRLRSVMNPTWARRRHQITQGLKLVLAAILAAGLIQMFRAPEVPAVPADTLELAPQINLELGDAAMNPANGPNLRYTEAQVNAYLASKLKSKQKVLSSYTRFERAVARFEEGVARATVERSLFGYSVFTSISFVPQIENAHVVARVTGGHFGRLPIHPALMGVAGFFFSDVTAVLDQDRRAIAKLGAIKVEPEAVNFLRPPPPR